MILPSGKNQITSAQYFGLSQMASEIGGTISLIQGMIGISIAYFMHKGWLESMNREIKKIAQASMTSEEANQKLMERVSYKGIYKLHDTVEMLEM